MAVEWNTEKAKEAALRAIVEAESGREVQHKGPFAHLYEKPLPKHLLVPRPLPSLLAFPSGRVPTPPSPLTPQAPLAPQRPAKGLRLNPNGAPSKAHPLSGARLMSSFAGLELNSPHGFCLNRASDELCVADTNHHRILVLDAGGGLLGAFGDAGREEGQLFYPRKVEVNPHLGQEFIVCDRGNERSRMQVFDRGGRFLRKIPIRFVDIVAGLTVVEAGEAGLICLVDSVSPSIFLIHPLSGELVAWFDVSGQLKEPSDVAHHEGQLLVCDFKGHCVGVFGLDGSFKRRLALDLTLFPNGIDVSASGEVLVADSHGNQIHLLVLSLSGEPLAEFDLQGTKVSRCCGLRITRHGHLVTLAKNNHALLFLNPVQLKEPALSPAEQFPAFADLLNAFPPASPRSPTPCISAGPSPAIPLSPFPN